MLLLVRRTGLLVVAAALLVVAGAVVTATAPPTSFGWFAYAPFSGDRYVPPSLDDGALSPALPLVLGGQQLVGAVLVVLGLVVAGVALGTRLGRRRPR
ncbi:hypothetical protein WDZ17_01685 [Pseudokineococcus basanitobsidens]|uniref:Cobalt/nickel transport protein n=1 Tax=Pseudokineococcus basanitobsidens TaxID=1926649 RepID=A0ABU8RG08_9ACTN